MGMYTENTRPEVQDHFQSGWIYQWQCIYQRRVLVLAQTTGIGSNLVTCSITEFWSQRYPMLIKWAGSCFRILGKQDGWRVFSIVCYSHNYHNLLSVYWHYLILTWHQKHPFWRLSLIDLLLLLSPFFFKHFHCNVEAEMSWTIYTRGKENKGNFQEVWLWMKLWTMGSRELYVCVPYKSNSVY